MSRFANSRFAVSRPLTTLSSRLRMAGLAACASLALAGCNATDSEVARKANKPLSPEMVSLLAKKDMAPSSPILVRIFKQESELEVWKVASDGGYSLLKTYPICRWSGELGPKVKVGDRQAPEGFYTIAPGQMNPNSSYYLAFNLGFPNAYDKAFGRTGEFLMVHGDCSSSGCYAMTDDQISEIFSLARESFAGGQRAFQVQAYPFRMTAKNLARYRNNPNMAFWRNLKQGSDHFEVTRQEPKVSVCNRTYVFDAEAAPGRGFDAQQACPPYQVAPQIASAVADKERRDNEQVAALASTAPLAPVRTGSDGGMHPVFLAKLKERETGQLSFSEAPGRLPEYVNPPKLTEAKIQADAQMRADAGDGSPATTASIAPAEPAAAAASAPAPQSAPRPGVASAALPPPAKPAAAAQKPATVAAAVPPGTLSGASPTVSTSTFSQ